CASRTWTGWRCSTATRSAACSRGDRSRPCSTPGPRRAGGPCDRRRARDGPVDRRRDRRRMPRGTVTSAATGDRLLSVDEARNAVLAAISGPTEPETAFLSEARGRILAEEVMSLTALP